nr:AAA family ATPase [Pseudomonas sp. TH41]
MVESSGLVELSEEELRVINFIVGANYSSVSVASIEEGFEKFPVVPYFKVVISDREYDSRGMGLGELSLFYFYWLITYMSKCDGARVLFVEEPESFLPPAALDRVLGFLFKVGDEQGIPILLTTHSERILGLVPRSHVRVIKNTIDGVRCSEVVTANEPLRVLGLSAVKRGILLVEDSAAEIFLKILINLSRTHSADSFYYVKSGSEGDIRKQVKCFPDAIDGFRVVGIFDGDMRDAVSGKEYANTAYCFLPGVIAPEKLLMEYIQSLKVVELAGVLGMLPDRVIEGLERAAGRDHHDFFVEFSKEVQRGFQDIFTLVCSHWAKSNEALVNIFLKELERYY